jgi:hypothetical protein
VTIGYRVGHDYNYVTRIGVTCTITGALTMLHTRYLYMYIHTIQNGTVIALLSFTGYVNIQDTTGRQPVQQVNAPGIHQRVHAQRKRV